MLIILSVNKYVIYLPESASYDSDQHTEFIWAMDGDSLYFEDELFKLILSGVYESGTLYLVLSFVDFGCHLL